MRNNIYGGDSRISLILGIKLSGRGMHFGLGSGFSASGRVLRVLEISRAFGSGSVIV